MSRVLSLPVWVGRFLGRCEADPVSECVHYTGAKNSNGYGAARMPVELAEAMDVPSRVTGAHRILYFLIRGEIEKGKHLDHLCNTRTCVNPYHLAAIDPLENSYRAVYYQRYGVTSEEQHYAEEDPFSTPLASIPEF